MRVERIILAMGTLVAVSFGPAASAAIDPIDAISVCSRISKKDARLQCYDQVAQDAASGRLTRSAPISQGFGTLPPGNALGAPPPLPGAPSQESRSQGFGGNSMRNSNGGDETNSVQVEVTSSTDNGLGQWRFHLADGAIWQMTERVSLFRPPAPHEMVTIRKAAMGSYMMDVGKQGSVRVSRIR